MSSEEFSNSVDGFSGFAASRKIDYFAYYLLKVEGKDGITKKDIEICFEDTHSVPYSNIGQYLAKGEGRKGGKFLKKKNNLYYLQAGFCSTLESEINITPRLRPSRNFVSLEIFENTRGYIQTTATQATVCFDAGAYDACLVMTRKLIEALIIELFERKGIDAKIKNVSTGHFFYLSDLIRVFLAEDGTTWNVSRNAKAAMPRIKALADQSAHNRRFTAKWDQVRSIKDDIELVALELVHLIDYPNWR